MLLSGTVGYSGANQMVLTLRNDTTNTAVVGPLDDSPIISARVSAYTFALPVVAGLNVLRLQATANSITTLVTRADLTALFVAYP